MAFALTLAYGAILQPDWEPRFNDQEQYLSLARGLVERGEFTRAQVDEPFIPETIRLPGYPLFLAPLCLGGCDHWRIAVAQAVLLGVLVFAAYLFARWLDLSRAVGLAFAVALYVPFAYYGALALSDLLGATLFSLGVIIWLRAMRARSSWWALAGGALFGWAALARAALVFVPLVLAAIAVARDRALARAAVASVLAAAIVVLPYVAYSELSFGRAFAGNSGVVLWLGALQGRSESTLDAYERSQVDAARTEIATFDAMSDRAPRALAWLRLDDSLGTRARALIAHDPLGWIARAVPRSVELWAGDLPVRGGASGDLAALIGAVQIVLFIFGVAGSVRLARRDLAGVVIAVVMVYVWLTALPFQTEARYSLPAKVFLIVGAVALFERRSRR